MKERGRSLTIALVNPPHVTPVNPDFESGVPPLGLGSIAAYLREAGYECAIFDLAEEWPLNSEQLAASGLYDHDVFGVTSYTKNFFAAEALVKELNANAPCAWIVMGGPHAGAVPSQVLDDIPEVDFVVRNEGEVPLLRLLEELEGLNPNLHDVPNLVYRGASGGIEFSSAEVKYPHIDSYPPPVRDMRFDRKRQIFKRVSSNRFAEAQFFNSSRGCPKKCNFCSIIVMSPKYRHRSVSSIVSEIKAVRASRNFNHVAFVDANFFAHWRRAVEFAEALYEYDSEMTWSGTATVDQICRHSDAILRMGDLNCVELEVGIENGSDAVLRRFNKNTTVEENFGCIEILRAARINLELDYILFDPFTSIVELRENVDFLIAAGMTIHAPAHFLYTATKLYPGTAIRSQYQLQRPLRADFYGIPPFLLKETQLVFNAQLKFAREFLSEIERAIELVDSLIETAIENVDMYPGGSVGSLSSLLVRLRQAPFIFFATLVSHAEHGADFALMNWRSLDAAIAVDNLLAETKVICTRLERANSGFALNEHSPMQVISSHGASFLLTDVARPVALGPEHLEIVAEALRTHTGANQGETPYVPRCAAVSLMDALGLSAGQSRRVVA